MAVTIDGSAGVTTNAGGSVNPSTNIDGINYSCRAWVNFNGSANTNLTGTYSQSGTTVTVTATAHGYIVGSIINADITSGTGVDGIYTVTAVTDANTFTYTAGTSLTTSGNVTLLRNTIRASGNVSSITDNGTADYTVNFTTAMTDTNYCAVIYGYENGYYVINAAVGQTKNTGSFAIGTYYTNSSSATWSLTNRDIPQMNVAIFR